MTFEEMLDQALAMLQRHGAHSALWADFRAISLASRAGS